MEFRKGMKVRFYPKGARLLAGGTVARTTRHYVVIDSALGRYTVRKEMVFFA